MRRLFAIFLVLIAVALPATAQDKAMRGVALVIGQSKYQHITALANPENDARDIEKLLENLGFEVTGVTNRDERKLRRDLERFTEDAQGADAAVIYYSGHGIEAGGENWLVPVDADLQALDDIGKSLVPLSEVLAELRAEVPLTVFLVDACRSNPFPPGTLARNQGKAIPLGGSGLTAPRGFSTVETAATDEIGTVIGFAAEPGLPALDGEPGAHSPYAAAILRHLSALAGSEFGLVMRMVTEEVYLKTETRQRPWVNESLRKQLYFGAPGEELNGDDGAITGERRKLLLTISALDEPQRKQVESIAASDAVPLDTLYAVLAALGETGRPKDPGALAELLKSQASRIKAMLDERKALSSDDAELKRLADAADRALAEGAIKAARGFLDQAKAVVAKSRDAVEGVEAQARAKRIANAEVLVKSADAAGLDFDFAAAAKDYAAAFDWVEPADQRLAAKYKSYEAGALQDIGTYQGSPQAFAQAITAYEEALLLISRDTDQVQWAKASNNLANVYLRLGERNLETSPLTKAIALYRDVLDVSGMAPAEQAKSQSNLGIALNTLAERNNDSASYAQARAAFAAAIEAHGKAGDKQGQAIDLLNAANLDVTLADRNGEPKRLDDAKEKITAALAVLDPAADRIHWAEAQNNLAIVQRVQGTNAHDVALVRQSLKTYEQVLPVFDRQTFPVDWASTNGNIAIAHTAIGAMEASIAEFEQAVSFYRLAFEEITRERAPVFWAKLNYNYGMTLQVIGQMKSDVGLLEQSATAFRGSLSVRQKSINAEQWAESQQLLAATLSALAANKSDPKLAGEAIEAYRAAREVFTREAFPSDWMNVSSGLAMALQGKGIINQDAVILKEAEAIYQDVLGATDRAKAPRDWASAKKDIATIQFLLGTTVMDKALVEQSIRGFDEALEELAISGSVMDRMMIGSMRQNAEKALALFE